MKTLFFLLLLSACATRNPPHTAPELKPEDARAATDEAGVDKSVRKPPTRKTARPTLPAAPPESGAGDPHCDVDADNQRAAILQKLDCLTEAAKK